MPPAGYRCGRRAQTADCSHEGSTRTNQGSGPSLVHTALPCPFSATTRRLLDLTASPQYSSRRLSIASARVKWRVVAAHDLQKSWFFVTEPTRAGLAAPRHAKVRRDGYGRNQAS
jgi:hypothetical protein